MRIIKSSYAVSAVKAEQFPIDDLPLVGMMGRSNAGKSSMINCLLERKSLARTSSTPGKTRLINFYRAEAVFESENTGDMLSRASFYIVDLPGYGYAKVSKNIRADWLDFMESFLQNAAGVKIIFHLVDIRHAPSAEDRLVSDILRNSGFTVYTVAVKADKISRSQKEGYIRRIARDLQLSSYAIQPFSSITKEGRSALLGKIELLINT